MNPHHTHYRLAALTVAAFLSLFAFYSSLFSAPADTYPKPNPAAQFSDYKLYDPANNNNRSWRAAREDWDNARTLTATDPAWKQWLADERAAVDAWMARHHDRVEWIAGWSHDGVSPKDGSALHWTDKIPGEETDHFTSPSDPRVEITPKLKAWWVVSFRGRHNRMMNTAARLYKLTGDTRYAEWAASQLDFYTDNFLKWEPQRSGQNARLYWQTLTEASNLVIYADTVRLLGDYVAPDRLENWRKNFFYPEVDAINANFQMIHNIATWQRCAAAQVALLFHDEAMWDAALNSTYGLRAQIAQGITSDYIWYEQSLGYNNFVVNAVLTLYTAAGLHDRAPLLDTEMSASENLMLSTTAMRFPDGALPNPADNKGRQHVPNLATFASAYRVFPTKLGLAAAADTRDWDPLLDPPAAIAAAYHFDPAAYDTAAAIAALPPVIAHNMETTRMAILRSGPWQVYIHYGQITRSHAHAEALNYEAYYNDTDITHDTGVVGYGSPLYKGYYQQGANHNVPLIDGQGQDLNAAPAESGNANLPIGKTESAATTPNNSNLLPAGARGQLISYAPAKITAAQDYYRKNARATRTLEINGDTLTDRVTLETTDNQPHTLGLTQQLQGNLKLPATFNPSAIPGNAEFPLGTTAQNAAPTKNRKSKAKNTAAPSAPATPFAYWRDITAADYTDRATLDIAYPDNLTMRLTIALPGKFRIYHGSTPDIPPRRRETLYIEQPNQTTATFDITLAPVK